MKLALEFGLLCRTVHRRLSQRVAQESERPHQQLKALRAIETEHISTQAELAERLCIDAPAASRLVDRLEEDGLLKRKPGENRRCVKLETTKRADKEIAAMNVSYEWLDKEMRRHLSAAELKTFEKIMEKLNTALNVQE